MIFANLISTHPDDVFSRSCVFSALLWNSGTTPGSPSCLTQLAGLFSRGLGCLGWSLFGNWLAGLAVVRL